MAVTSAAVFINRYIGSSADTKPALALLADGVTVDANSIPVGSTFYEKDTGIIAQWDGAFWTRPPAAFDQRVLADALVSIRSELTSIRLGMVETGMCTDIRDADLVSTLSES